jgi:addiction module RelE/StbE family toxin
LRLVWLESALDDLDAIIDYIGERNYPAALRLQQTIEACAELLAEHPYIHRSGRIRGTREAVVHPNYVVIYRVGADSVEIVNVIHSRREYP